MSIADCTTLLVQYRMKYAEDLEDILQCPVCLERPEGDILLCIQGHHICTTCHQQIHECPMCRSRFLGTRSFLAESLALKLDEIKTSLLDPSHTTNKRVLRNKVSRYTQTDFKVNDVELNINNNVSNTTVIQPSQPPATSLSRPPVGKGIYPCRIFNCLEKHPHGRMIPHLRYYHAQRLYKIQISDKTYTNSWELKYASNETFDSALHISSMGIFFMIIRINENGDFKGNLQIVNSHNNAQQFKYKLEVTNGRKSISFSDSVPSCKLNETKLELRNLKVSKSEMLDIVNKETLFTCMLTLKRLVEHL